MKYLHKYRRYIGHVSFCLLFVFMAGQIRGGMFLEMGLVLFVLGCIFKLFEIRKASDKKRWLYDFRNKILVWCIGFLVVFLVHQYHKQQLNIAVNNTLGNIDTFYEKTGKYPELNQLNQEYLKSHRIHYLLKANKPSLFYEDSFKFRAFHLYDFETKTWEYRVD